MHLHREHGPRWKEQTSFAQILLQLEGRTKRKSQAVAVCSIATDFLEGASWRYASICVHRAPWRKGRQLKHFWVLSYEVSYIRLCNRTTRVYANVLQQATGDGCIQRQDAFQLSSFKLKTCLKGSLSLATAQHRCSSACAPLTALAFGQQCWVCNSLQATALLSSAGLGFNCRMSCGRSNLRRSHKADIICKVGIEDYGLTLTTTEGAIEQNWKGLQQMLIPEVKGKEWKMVLCGTSACSKGDK